MAKIRRLSQEQVVKLSTWLILHKATLELAPARTCKAIARMAATDLGFPIAGNTITRMAAHTGITLPAVATSVLCRQTVNRKKIELLRDHLVLLYAKCGEPTPEDLGVNWPADVAAPPH